MIELAPEYRSPNVPEKSPELNHDIDAELAFAVLQLAPYYTAELHMIEAGGTQCPVFSLELDTSVYAFESVSKILDDIFARYEEDGLLYPVSTSGLKDYTGGIGSHRFCADSEMFARVLTEIIKMYIGNLTMTNYKFVNVSRYFRFMRYVNGGEHFPHYDSDFRYTIDGKDYATRFTLVMYFDDLESGEFAFTKHAPQSVPDLETALKLDFDRQATEDEIAMKFAPRRGRILMFPHELCHTVLPMKENKQRRIVRGDLLFAKKGNL